MTTKDNTQDVQGVVDETADLLIATGELVGDLWPRAQANLQKAASLLLSEHEGRVRAEAENEQLRLAICGGEDAPGYAASVPLSQIIEIAQTQGRERAELAEAATAIAQARVEELERALGELLAACIEDFGDLVEWPDDAGVSDGESGPSTVTFGHIRRARQALNPTGAAG